MPTVRLRTISAIAAVIAVLIIIVNDRPPTSASGGLVNPGFESGTLNGNPWGWTVVNPVADVVRVVGTEGPAQFPTYVDMGNITVSPYKGNLMLRTGTPQRLAQNQDKGDNKVIQTFSSTSSTLDLAFRIFSWEHRGQDLVQFDVKDGRNSIGSLAAPIQLKTTGGSVIATCSGVPCQLAIDVGEQGQFIDSGWMVANIINLPADGRPLTISYQVTGTKDASKPTWAYWDNVNTPPVAKFSMAPSDPQEGDVVQFLDLSYDPDPGDTIVSRTWVINGQTFTSQNPFFVFPDEGSYSASLTVVDSFGASTTVRDGETATDGDLVPDLTVTNARPLVNALNVEALSGQETKLVGRFLDAGYNDIHTANWSINGNPAATVEEEHDPLLSSGLVSGKVTPTSNLTGTLSVNDADGGSASDSFNVTIIPDTTASHERFEPNDTTTDPLHPVPILQVDGSYVSFLQREGDIDLYEVRAPGGAQVKAGSEILASLTNLQADADIAILSKLPTDASTGWSRFGFSRFGFSRFGFSRFDSSVTGFSRFGFSRFGYSRFGDSQVGLTGFNNSGVSWSDIGYSRFGFSRFGFLAGGNEVTPLDVGLAELGLGSVGGSDIQVADFSANRGLDDETAWARSSLSGTTFYVAVFASDGEKSVTPYTLSIETIEPPDLQLDLGAVCNGSPLVASGATASPVVLYDYDDPNTPQNDPADTVFITQEQRMRATYSLDDAGWNQLLGDLATLAQHPSVRADVLSVPSVFFDDADTHPCNVEATNSTSNQIRSLLSAAYPNAENYVIVGNDDIVPFRRVLDYTVIGNEKDYLLDSFLKAGSKSFAAVLQGYMLTDDYYGDLTGQPWQGNEAYIPTKSLGRLVETPVEIRAQAQAFLESNGILNPATGSVFGYDFFKDGANSIGDSLDAGLSGAVDRQISDTWTAGDMRCRFLGQGADPACGVRDVASPNGHSTHFGILSANGFSTDNFSDFLSGEEVATTGGGVPVLKNTVVFTMGCHAGFNSPDSSSEGPDAGTGINPALDLAQAMARQRAVYIASTGYGIGDDAGVGGHEKLMTILPQEMLKGGVTVGEANRNAKQAFLDGLATTTVYELKVSMETTLYGLPMYRVDPVAATALLAVPVQENLGNPAGSFTLTTEDATSTVPTVTTTHQLESNTGPRGTYYTLDGESTAAAGRALQPKFAGNIDERHPHSGAPPPVHGIRITGGSYTDIPGNDPVFSRPKFEWEIVPGESQECLAGYSPSGPASINSFERGGDLRQTLVVVAGQFRCTSGAASTVTGIERLYNSLSLDVRRCSSSDTTTPMLNDIQLREVDATTVQARIDASDAGGLSRIDVLRVDDGQIVPFSLMLSQPLPTSGIFNINVPGVKQTTDLLVQVEDANCNVTLDTYKSAGLNFIKVDAGPDQLMPANRTVTLTGTISGFTSLTSPAWFVWGFGDGTFLDGVLLPESKRTVNVTVDALGNATFSVQHTYASGIATPITASLEVQDSAGGNGSDETRIVCDPAGDAESPDGDWIGCGSSNTNTKMTIAVTVDGAVTDQFQYRVYVDAGRYNTKKKRWEQPPDGVFDAQLKYNGGQVTGLPSLTVQVVGNQLRFTFDLAEFGLSPGNVVQWYAETQAGTPGTPATGKIDRMPDIGWLRQTIQ